MCIIPINKSDRVAIFIDNANLVMSTVKEPSIQRVVYESLVKELTAGRNLRFVHAHDTYTHYEDGTINRGFEHHLSNLGITPLFRDSFSPDSNTQKEVDAAMTLDIYKLAAADCFDTAIIVSGDRDFVPVAEELERMGKNVEIACTEESISGYLRTHGSRFWNLSEMTITELFDRNYNMNTKEE